MARPTKVGLDYFPYDVNPDRKMKILIRKFGFDGEGVFINILKIIYNQGYFTRFCDDSKDDFCIEFGIKLDRLNDILSFLIDKDFFSKEAFEKFGILTSNGIQTRFLEATKKRKANNEILHYRVNSVNNLVNSELTLVNSELIPMKCTNSDISTQSKVKESKVNKSKEIKDSVCECPFFEIWWNKYEKKGNRKKALEHWETLTFEVKEICLSVVDEYVFSTPNLRYRLDANNYLADSHWNDEIIDANKNERDNWLSGEMPLNQNQEVAHA